MRIRSILGLTGLLILASACSAVIDGDDYRGGGTDCDAAVCLPDGGGGDPVAQQQQILDINDQREANWCDCFWETWGYASASACEEQLGTSDAYETCVLGAAQALADADPPVDTSFLSCQLEARRAALSCESDATCALGSFGACQTALVQTEVVDPTGACVPTEDYFDDLIACAQANVVGPPSGVCPGPLFTGVTFTDDNLGSGNDFDLTGSECFVNSGAADQVLQWQANADGDVIIDTLGSYYDTTLYLIDDCTQRNVLQCNDDVDSTSGMLQSRLRAQAVAGESLTVMVDAFSTADFGALRVNFTTLHCADVDTTNIPSTVGQAALDGSIALMGDDDDLTPITDGCAPLLDLAGADDVVAWRAPADGTYSFDTDGSAVDTVLYLRRSCDPESPAEDTFEVCDDDSGDGTASSIEASLVAGETVLLVVEAKGLGGAWQINIQ